MIFLIPFVLVTGLGCTGSFHAIQLDTSSNDRQTYPMGKIFGFAISGVEYLSQSGQTPQVNSNGEVVFANPDEQITLSLGTLKLVTFKANATQTNWFQIFLAAPPNTAQLAEFVNRGLYPTSIGLAIASLSSEQNRAINTAGLLMSLDIDSDFSNGIQISKTRWKMVETQVANLDLEDKDFLSNLMKVFTESKVDVGAKTKLETINAMIRSGTFTAIAYCISQENKNEVETEVLSDRSIRTDVRSEESLTYNTQGSIINSIFNYETIRDPGGDTRVTLQKYNRSYVYDKYGRANDSRESILVTDRGVITQDSQSALVSSYIAGIISPSIKTTTRTSITPSTKASNTTITVTELTYNSDGKPNTTTSTTRDTVGALLSKYVTNYIYPAANTTNVSIDSNGDGVVDKIQKTTLSSVVTGGVRGTVKTIESDNQADNTVDQIREDTYYDPVFNAATIQTSSVLKITVPGGEPPTIDSTKTTYSNLTKDSEGLLVSYTMTRDNIYEYPVAGDIRQLTHKTIGQTKFQYLPCPK
jgi:hypothetical protein